MTVSEETLRQFEARAEWVKGWWAGNQWLGKKGAVPEVRNLCEDVFEVAAELRAVRADNERLREAVTRIAAVKPDAIQWTEQNHQRLWKAVSIARDALAASAALGEDA